MKSQALKVTTAFFRRLVGPTAHIHARVSLDILPHVKPNMNRCIRNLICSPKLEFLAEKSKACRSLKFQLASDTFFVT